MAFNIEFHILWQRDCVGVLMVHMLPVLGPGATQRPLEGSGERVSCLLRERGQVETGLSKQHIGKREGVKPRQYPPLIFRTRGKKTLLLKNNT